MGVPLHNTGKCTFCRTLRQIEYICFHKISVYLSLSLCHSLSLSVSVSFSLSLCRSVSYPFSLSFSLFISLSLSFSLFLSLSLSYSFSLSLSIFFISHNICKRPLLTSATRIQDCQTIN